MIYGFHKDHAKGLSWNTGFKDSSSLLHAINHGETYYAVSEKWLVKLLWGNNHKNVSSFENVLNNMNDPVRKRLEENIPDEWSDHTLQSPTLGLKKSLRVSDNNAIHDLRVRKEIKVWNLNCMERQQNKWPPSLNRRSNQQIYILPINQPELLIESTVTNQQSTKKKPYHHMKRTRTNRGENRLSTNNKIIRSNYNQIAESNRPRIDQKSTAPKQKSSNCQQNAKATRVVTGERLMMVVSGCQRLESNKRSLVRFRVSKTGFVI